MGTDGNRLDINKVIMDFGGRIRKPLTCELCGGTKWTGWDLAPLHITPPGVPAGAMVVGGPFLPLLAIGCEGCGNTKLLNLVLLGHVPRATSPQGLQAGDRLINDALGNG